MSGIFDSHIIRSEDAHENFDTWIARDYIGAGLKEQLRQANVLIVPIEGFRDEKLVAFPVKTDELYRFMRERSPKGLTVDICIEDDRYCELALHADLIVIGTFVVTNVILPVCLDLISDYIKEKLTSRAKDSQVKVNFTVVESDGSSRSLSYEGPPEFLKQVLPGRDNDKLTES